MLLPPHAVVVVTILCLDVALETGEEEEEEEEVVAEEKEKQELQ